MIYGLYTKWIIGGISLLIIYFCACYVWYYKSIEEDKQEAAETAEFARRELSQKANTKTRKGQTTSSNTPVDSNTLTTEITTQVNAESENTTAEQPTPKESPFGLGPYPEIPKDWDTPYLWEGCDTIYDELLARVTIKMHNEGIYSKYSSVGIDHGTGLITSIEYGTVLVEYETNEKGEQVIWRVLGHPDEVPPDAASIWKRITDIPSNLKVVTPEDVSIDPYEYLGL